MYPFICHYSPDYKLACTHSASVLHRDITNIKTCYNNVKIHRKTFSCSSSVFKDNYTLKRGKAMHTNKFHTNYRSKKMFSMLMRYCSPDYFLSFLLHNPCPCFTALSHTKTWCSMQAYENDVNVICCIDTRLSRVNPGCLPSCEKLHELH